MLNLRPGRVRTRRCVVVLALCILAGSGCRRLGYTDRVLWRVPSPDGGVVAVCQEIPEFDGPGYDVRLESAQRARITTLLRSGDGDPCSELAWSPDGQVLAVLSAHVARVRFVDVGAGLKTPAGRSNQWASRQVDLSSDGDVRRGRNLRFVGPLDVELSICSYSLQAASPPACTSPEVLKRFQVPSAVTVD